MKKNRTWVVVLALVAVVSAVAAGLVLSGFFKPTAMGLTKKAVKNLSKVQSLRSNITVEYEGTLQIFGQDADYSMNADCDLQMVTDSGTSYISGTLGTTIPFIGDLSVPIESYQQSQGESVISYTRINNSDWLKNQSDLSQVESAAENSAPNLNYKTVLGIMQKIASGEIKADLAEETEMLHGQEAYRMDIQIAGDLLNDLLKATSASASGEGQSELPEDFDISEGDASIVFYVYKDSKLPAKMVIDCTALGNAVMSNLGKDDVGDNSEFAASTAKKFMITGDIYEYNTIDELVVPADVVDSAKEMEEFDILSIFMGE